jgi:AmpD protein
MKFKLNDGLIDEAEYIASPNCDEREHCESPEVVIIHCISLPPGEYGQGAIQRFFANELSVNEHPYYQSMAHLTVSSHFLIERTGKLIQFVPTHMRAWHAGESVCLGKPKVNDFSIGIELEGLDTDENGFTEAQYECLNKLKEVLDHEYPSIDPSHYFAHSDIAPGRKPDPGRFFDWSRIIVNN